MRDGVGRRGEMTTVSTMPLLIVEYPVPVLRKRTAPVERITPELQEFLREMGDMMYAANGVGLAAPQVGIALRMIVVDAGNGLQMLINPQIISREGSQTGPEGCLSLPGLFGDVTRAQHVVVRAVNLRGKKITLSGDDLWARAMQHEIDHLDGILFTDKVIEETLHWVTGETNAEGDPLTRATSLQDALQFFERREALRA
ncbi:MAG: peptide deformylase [Armatimonadota bacterium]